MNPWANFPPGCQKKRWPILLSAFLLAGIAALVLSPLESEPSYHGRKLSRWLAQYTTAVYKDGDMSGPAALEARQAVLQIGTNAIPKLLEWMPGSRQPLRMVEQIRSTLRLPFLGTYRAIGLLFGYSPTGRNTLAVYGFSILGERASPALPDLARMLNDTNAVHDTVLCLAFMGKPGLDRLVLALADTNQMDRPYIAALLGNAANPTNAPEFTAALQPCAQSADPELTAAASRALERIRRLTEHPVAPTAGPDSEAP